MKRAKDKERGVAAVEFGLLLPVLLMILLGMMEYGYLYFVHLNMTNAAREGARVGVVQENVNVITAAETAAQAYLNAAGVGGTPAATFDQTTVEVTVTTAYNPLIGFVPTPSTLQARASMRWELAPPPP